VDLRAGAVRDGKPLRILVTRLRYLGDVILTTPAVAALKERYPEAEIYYLAERPYADILRENPSLAGVISLAKGARGSLAAVSTLRSLRFSAAIDLFYNPRSAFLLCAAGIPVRVGGSRRMRRRLYTHIFAAPETRSAVGHHLAALKVLDIDADETLPRVYLSPEEEAAGSDLVEKMIGMKRERAVVIAMHPGGTWPAKRWPRGSFAALARIAREKLGAKIVLIEGPGEHDITESVASRAGGDISILPPGSLRRAASILASCSAVVANDGGIMHLAVALNVPTVGVFGPTEPDIWFPYEGKGPFSLVTHEWECAPCHKHVCEAPRCLDGIEPREVLEHLEKVLIGRK